MDLYRCNHKRMHFSLCEIQRYPGNAIEFRAKALHCTAAHASLPPSPNDFWKVSALESGTHITPSLCYKGQTKSSVSYAFLAI